MNPIDGEYLGRYQQGQEVPLLLRCVNADLEPETPQAAPTVKVYRDAAPPVLVETLRMARVEQGEQEGAFRLPRFLGPAYATAGRYLVTFHWLTQDAVAMTRCCSFTLLPGGDADGAVISMYHIERPNARYLIWQTDGGRLARGKNPR